ncbi:hypothetical protein LINPERHAP1_LOCUS18450 [Linum perenne]
MMAKIKLSMNAVLASMNAFRSALISTAAQIDYSSLSLVYLLTEWMNMINKRSWVNHPIEGASELG